MKALNLLLVFTIASEATAKLPPVLKPSPRDTSVSTEKPIIVTTESTREQTELKPRRSAPPFYDGISNYGSPGLFGSQVYGFGLNPVPSLQGNNIENFPGSLNSWSTMPDIMSQPRSISSGMNFGYPVGYPFNPWSALAYPGYGMNPFRHNFGRSLIEPWVYSKPSLYPNFDLAAGRWGYNSPYYSNTLDVPPGRFFLPVQASYSVGNELANPVGTTWAGNYKTNPNPGQPLPGGVSIRSVEETTQSSVKQQDGRRP